MSVQEQVIVVGQHPAPISEVILCVGTKFPNYRSRHVQIKCWCPESNLWKNSFDEEVKGMTGQNDDEIKNNTFDVPPPNYKLENTSNLLALRCLDSQRNDVVKFVHDMFSLFVSEKRQAAKHVSPVKGRGCAGLLYLWNVVMCHTSSSLKLKRRRHEEADDEQKNQEEEENMTNQRKRSKHEEKDNAIGCEEKKLVVAQDEKSAMAAEKEEEEEEEEEEKEQEQEQEENQKVRCADDFVGHIKKHKEKWCLLPYPDRLPEQFFLQHPELQVQPALVCEIFSFSAYNTIAVENHDVEISDHVGHEALVPHDEKDEKKNKKLYSVDGKKYVKLCLNDSCSELTVGTETYVKPHWTELWDEADDDNLATNQDAYTALNEKKEPFPDLDWDGDHERIHCKKRIQMKNARWVKAKPHPIANGPLPVPK